MLGHTWQASVRSIDARDERQYNNCQNTEESGCLVRKVMNPTVSRDPTASGVPPVRRDRKIASRGPRDLENPLRY